MFKRHDLKNDKHFLEFLFNFFQSPQNFAHFEKKKDQFQSLNIWEIIKSGKCGYLNPQKLLNPLRESTCSRVPKTTQISKAALLS